MDASSDSSLQLMCMFQSAKDLASLFQAIVPELKKERIMLRASVEKGATQRLGTRARAPVRAAELPSLFVFVHGFVLRSAGLSVFFDSPHQQSMFNVPVRRSGVVLLSDRSAAVHVARFRPRPSLAARVVCVLLRRAATWVGVSGRRSHRAWLGLELDRCRLRRDRKGRVRRVSVLRARRWSSRWTLRTWWTHSRWWVPTASPRPS